MTGNIDADFLHDFDGQGMNVASRLFSSALNIENIAGDRAENPFSEVAAAGIGCAQDEDGRFTRLHAAILVFRPQMNKACF